MAYSAVLSMASVPVVALLLARVARSGVTLWAAVASAAIVLASGAVAACWRGPAPGSADPVLRPPAIRDGRALALVVIALALVLLLVPVALIGLPYLLVQRCRDQARVLALALAGLALLSAAYAWYIYGLGEIAGGGSATSRAAGIAIGSQAPLSPGHVLAELSPPILWLGVFGGAALAVNVRRLRPPQVLAAVTVLTWCALLPPRVREPVRGDLRAVGYRGPGLPPRPLGRRHDHASAGHRLG